MIAVNLECVITTKGKQGIAKGEGGPYYYRARPEMVNVLLEAGVDIVTTANNHAGDYGPEALLQQNELLKTIGLQQAGSGRNRLEALQPVYCSVKGINLALFSIDTTQRHFAATDEVGGTAYFDPKKPKLLQQELAPLIRKAKRQVHVVLVAAHYGLNGSHEVTSENQALAYALIDAGADAVLGSSAHELQAIEVYKNRPIIHDAGDLLFDAVQSKSRKGGIFQLTLCQQGVKAITFIPVAVGYGQTHELMGTVAEQASKDYSLLCSKLKTRLTINKKGHGYLALDVNTEKQATSFPYFKPPSKRKFNAALMPELEGQWTVKRVPDEAVISPIRFGPIQLLGVRVINQHLKKRQMIWVESFWTLKTKTQENVRIDFQAVPLGKTTMRPWGRAMDHDPCDWLKPVSTWESGVVYRDFYGLRPPHLKEWDNGELQLIVNVIAAQPLWQPVPLPIKIKLNHQAKESLFDEKGDLIDTVHYPKNLQKDDVVLLKGSRRESDFNAISDFFIKKFQLYGDRDVSSRSPIDEIKNNTKADQEKLAIAKLKKTKNIPWVILARPGTYGSSGNHKEKRMLSEFLAINKALDGLKGRYGIERFIIVGHSGGATLGAGLLTLGRTDIQCAILSSGTYDYLARRALKKLEQNSFSYDSQTRKVSQQYDPYLYTENIVKDPNRKIFIMGDTRDKNTPFHLQLAFAFKLEKAGHQVNIVEFAGKGPDHHNINESDFIFNKRVLRFLNN